MAASRIIADEIRASKRRGSISGFGGGDLGEEEDEGHGWGDVQDIHDLNNPFDLLGEEDGEDN